MDAPVLARLGFVQRTPTTPRGCTAPIFSSGQLQRWPQLRDDSDTTSQGSSFKSSEHISPPHSQKLKRRARAHDESCDEPVRADLSQMSQMSQMDDSESFSKRRNLSGDLPGAEKEAASGIEHEWSTTDDEDDEQPTTHRPHTLMSVSALTAMTAGTNLCSPAVPNKSTEPPPRLPTVDGFVACETFAGVRQGMVFRSGSAGVGYYPDIGLLHSTAPPLDTGRDEARAVWGGGGATPLSGVFGSRGSTPSTPLGMSLGVGVPPPAAGLGSRSFVRPAGSRWTAPVVPRGSSTSSGRIARLPEC